MPDRIIVIDVLRVMAICYIIMVRHIDDYASEMFQSPLVIDLTIISLGIIVFISGYLLASSNTIFNSIADIRRFLVKRVLRIYPLYASALFIFYMLSIVTFDQMYSGLLLYNIFTGNYILTLWFISMIIVYYVVFATLNYKSNPFIFGLISAIIFLLMLIEKLTVHNADGGLILYFPVFICGILAKKYFNNLKLSINKSIFMLSLLLILLYLNTNNLVWSKLSIIIYNIMISSFTLLSMFCLSKIKINAIITKIIINLSYASFCMYLTHRIIFEISLFVYKPRSDIMTLMYLYLVAVPIIFIVSFYIQRYYDKLMKAIQQNSWAIISFGKTRGV